MARNILFTAAVILIVLSLFLPWFTINQSQERSVKDGFYEDGVNVKTETSASVKYYLDHAILKAMTEESKGSNSERTYTGENDHYSEHIESGDELNSTESFLYSFYKITLVILALSFIIIVLEGFGQGSDLSSMKMGIALLHLIIIILFLSGIKSSVLETQGDEVVLESPNSNEYVNMTLPFGIGKSLVSNDTHNEYYTLEDSSSYGFEKTEIETTSYDNTGQGQYFRLFSGPGPDDIDWDKNNWNTTFQYENETTYYVWFDRQALDANVSDRDPTPESTDDDKYVSMRVEIAGLEESDNSAATIRNRIVQVFDASNAPFSATANQTVNNILYVESTYYGNQRNAEGWNYGGDAFVIENGFLDYTESTADTKFEASWYPSTGFVVSFLAFGCFVGSHFEDS